ncbi:PTS system IIC component, L-Asc family (TC 4.A.7) [Brevinema andersonii]|uniref:Ascorbate-specific PTS system EIIC component n=1 Tax=Brevinema andersonii TaxID=34097 RepID=A0A1I1DNZ3_BREAD|nr:PTS ascorbate transporter subunit IIC [Brevinema andersonii]SFB76685.1 PTS system IIC component, L-Asc family (TC 4.A.7) [Brevinema andersonii]
MNIILNIFSFFTNNILTKPEFFIGLIVLIGYILLDKPWYESLSGFIKATVGYMILNVGAGGLVVTFRPILAGLNDRFNLNAAVIDPYFGLNAVNAALESVGVVTSYTLIALLFGFFWNIFLVAMRKYTKLRVLFVTGHIMVQQATTITWLVFFAAPSLRNTTGAALVGLLVGTYWAVFSNLTVEPTENLTDNAGFALGHQQMLAVWVTDRIAAKMGNPEKNLENIKLPGWLHIFNDSIVSSSIIMVLFFGVIMSILGEDYMRQLDKNFANTVSFPIYILSKSLLFAVYLHILREGVRMFVAEMTESFHGISSKLLPGVMPGVDCAATYGFTTPNTILWGFILGASGQFIAIAGLLIFKSPIMIIPGFVPLFFDNATIAVYANKRGGIRAATLLPLFTGIFQVLGGAFCAWYFELYKYGGWHGNIDFSTLWLVAGIFIKVAPIAGSVTLILLMLIIPQIQYKIYKNTYWKHGE